MLKIKRQKNLRFAHPPPHRGEAPRGYGDRIAVALSIQRAQEGVITIVHEVELGESATGIANVVHPRIGSHDVAGCRPRVRPDALQVELVGSRRQIKCAGSSRQVLGKYRFYRIDEAANVLVLPCRRFLF